MIVTKLLFQYNELFDLLDGNIQDGSNNDERFLGNFDDDVPPNPNLMPHHKTSENKVIKEKEKIRYEDLPQESVDNLINAITVSQICSFFGFDFQAHVHKYISMFIYVYT